jgi:hypothetical protein
MLRPKHFGFNKDTHLTNRFQNNIQEDEELIKIKALNEFDNMVKLLENHQINVDVFQDKDTFLPDAVFMNNWLSFFPDGKLIIYPMHDEIRRKERRRDIIDKIIEKYDITEFIDLTYFENQNKFLESTGSVVFDHKNKTAYACKSPRTDEEVFDELCNLIGYKGFFFEANDLAGQPIYHTNVMMAIFKKSVIICLDCIENNLERQMIYKALKSTKRTVVEISYHQLNHFVGNAYEVINREGKSKIIMSRTAYSSLTEDQKNVLLKDSDIVAVNISIIERIGGGSARCMLTGLTC